MLRKRWLNSGGLINGLRAFEVPRLEITPVDPAATFPTNPTVIYDFKLLNVQNTVVNVTYSVYLEAKAYNEATDDREKDRERSYAFVSPAWDHLQTGQKRLTATFANNDPVHDFYLFGTWEEPAQAGGVYAHRSNAITFYNPPAAPQVSLQTGTYTGAQTVSITSPFTEGSIFYRLQQKNKADFISTLPITGGELKISEDTLLTVATYHNHVLSNDAYYQYTINSAPVVFGGGGPSGGGDLQPAPSLNKDGKMVYDFKPTHIDMLIELNKQFNELTLDAKTKENVDVLSIEIDADIVQRASQLNRPIVIASNDISMQIPPYAWPVKLSSGKVLFTSTKTNTSIPHFTSASPIYDFSVTDNGSKISLFGSPVQVTIPFDAKKVQNVHNLSVYVFDEDQGAWTPIGGTLNSDGTISASLAHFSKYAVLEKQADTNLQDIKNHWAQKEIEDLAGRGIIDGIDNHSFQPDGTMTRAQFVTIIAKALKLQDDGKASMFNDVPNWSLVSRFRLCSLFIWHY